MMMIHLLEPAVNMAVLDFEIVYNYTGYGGVITIFCIRFNNHNVYT